MPSTADPRPGRTSTQPRPQVRSGPRTGSCSDNRAIAGGLRDAYSRSSSRACGLAVIVDRRLRVPREPVALPERVPRVIARCGSACGGLLARRGRDKAAHADDGTSVPHAARVELKCHRAGQPGTSRSRPPMSSCQSASIHRPHSPPTSSTSNRWGRGTIRPVMPFGCRAWSVYRLEFRSPSPCSVRNACRSRMARRIER